METPAENKNAEMIKIIVQIGALMSLFFLSSFAFSNNTKELIKKRAKFKSEISGRNDMEMHCIHIDHRRDKYYNMAGNGFYGTILEHYAHHLMFRGKAHMIGLSESENEWSIGTLYNNLVKDYEKRGYDIDNIDHDLDIALSQVECFISKLYIEG